MPPTRSTSIAYWTTTALPALAFLLTGIGSLVPLAYLAHDIAHLGYPPYVLKILGTWKVLAALVMVLPGLPRAKEWAYAGMCFDLTGAAASRFLAGDAPALIAIPLLIAAAVMASWSLRPAGRKLLPLSPVSNS